MAKGRKDKAGTEDLPKAKITGESLRKAAGIFRYLKGQQWKFFLGMIFLLLTGITAVVFPRLMGLLIDSGEISAEKINQVGLWLLLLFALQAVSSFFRVVLFVNVTESMLASVRQAAYGNLIRMPMSYFTQNRVGEINSRLSADLSQIQDSFTTNIAEFLRQLIIIFGGITALFFTSLKLAFFMLAVIPLVAIIAVVFGRFIRKLSREVQDRVAESNTIVEETLQGISNVKSFTNEWFEMIRYKSATDKVRDLAIKAGVFRGAFFSFIIFCLFGAIVLLIWYAVKLESAGELTHGEMIQFMLYTVFVGASIGGIAEQYAQLQKAIGATDRVMEIISSEPEPVELENKRAAQKLQGNISFRNVSFAYPSRPEVEVLKGVSFDASVGHQIAIVGTSGGGKSTITSLLQRFYIPQGGDILLDGKSSSSYTLDDIRSNMAIVPQDVLLFGGSIRENIAYGKPGATDEEITEAARKANAHDFISGFPEGYQTLVGDRGIKLSGGQRQRIAIARAVLKNPAILILDEATSSLDAESERLVQEALEKLMIGRTSIVIAHRLSTIRNAHAILVLDKGVIAESGKHEELIAKQGLYYQLNKMQFEGMMG